MKVRVSRKLADDELIDNDDIDIQVDPNTGALRVVGELDGGLRTLAAFGPGEWLAARIDA